MNKLYKPDKNYKIEITLTDNSKDVFNLKGEDAYELASIVYLRGYHRKISEGQWQLISPFIINSYTITEK